MTSGGLSALDILSSVPQYMGGPRHPDSPPSLSLLGNGLTSGLPSIPGPLRSGSAGGLPSFGGSLNLEELLGELAQAQSAAMSQQHQQLHQHLQAQEQLQRLAEQQQQSNQRSQQRLPLPPTSSSFSASQPRSSTDGAKSSEEIWRSIHSGLTLNGGGLSPAAWAGPSDDVLSKHGEGTTPRLGSSLASVPSAATHFGPAGGSVATLSAASMNGSVGGAMAGGRSARAIIGTGSMSSTRAGSGHGGMRLQSGSTEMASSMAAAALAVGADPSWFSYMGGGPSIGGLPSLDHALQTVAASRSQQWAQAAAAMGGGGSTSTSGSPSQAAPANQVYSRGQSGGSHLQPQQQQRQQQHGSNSLDLSQYIAATAAMGPGGDMRSSSLESTMELTRSLQRKFMAEGGRSAAASPRSYLPQHYQEPATAVSASLGGEYANQKPSGAAAPRTSPSPSPPRFDADVAVQAADATMMAAQRRGGRAPRSPSSLPSVASDTPSMRSMPAIPAGGGSVGRPSGSASAPPAANGNGGLSARQRHKLTKGRTVDMDEKEMRDMKRKEANRESAARSRDKRLKLIADLEVEVEQLKRKHEAFKERVIQTTVPRELAEAPANGRRLMPLRRANTDPLDAASRIANALAQAPVDAAKAVKTAMVNEGEGQPTLAADSCADGRCNGNTPSADGALKRESTAEPALRTEA